MTSGTGIRILAIVGIIAVVGAQGAARAQSSASSQASTELTWQTPDLRPKAMPQASADSDLQIRSTRSLSNCPTGTLRFVQATAPVEPMPPQSEQTQPIPLQSEPIAPGKPQTDDSGFPLSAPPVLSPAPGSYENIDLGWKPIGAVSASIAPPTGDLPANLAAPMFAQAGTVVAPINANHVWPTFAYSWEASAVPHNPLYFEDVNLERYGYSHGILQPWISGGRFFLNVIFLPYHIVAEPPGRLEYPLGLYRPGDPAPPVRQIKPIKLSATAAEAAFIVGMIIILP